MKTFIYYGVMILLLVKPLHSMDKKDEKTIGLSQEEVEFCVKNSDVFAQLLFDKSCGSTRRLSEILDTTEVDTGHVHFIYTHVNAPRTDPFRRLSVIKVHSHPRNKVTDKYYKLDKNRDTFVLVKIAVNVAKLDVAKL